MSDGIDGLARRLVVGRKSDGRNVYDEVAKAELVGACGRPGVSVSRLAREVGINANQLSRWVREHSQRRQRAVAMSPGPREAFVAAAIESSRKTFDALAVPSNVAARCWPSLETEVALRSRRDRRRIAARGIKT